MSLMKFEPMKPRPPVTRSLISVTPYV
jgi:hypothetical protein